MAVGTFVATGVLVGIGVGVFVGSGVQVGVGTGIWVGSLVGSLLEGIGVLVRVSVDTAPTSTIEHPERTAPTRITAKNAKRALLMEGIIDQTFQLDNGILFQLTETDVTSNFSGAVSLAALCRLMLLLSDTLSSNNGILAELSPLRPNARSGAVLAVARRRVARRQCRCRML